MSRVLDETKRSKWICFRLESFTLLNVKLHFQQNVQLPKWIGDICDNYIEHQN